MLILFRNTVVNLCPAIRFPYWVACFWVVTLSAGVAAIGQDTSTENPPNQTSRAETSQISASKISDVSVGIQGQVRLGHWSEVRLSASGLPAGGQLVLRAVDSDEIPVDYYWPLTPVPEVSPPTVVGYFRLGRKDHRVRLQVTDQEGEIWDQVMLDFSAESGRQLQPATRPFWLQLGPDFGISSATISLQNSQDSGIVLIESDPSPDQEVSSLPVTERGWESLDRIIANTATTDWIDHLGPAGRQSLQQWLVQGGRISLLVTPGAESLVSEQGALSSWTGSIKAVGSSTSRSSSLEYFVGSRTQLLGENQTRLEFVGFPDANDSELTIDDAPVMDRLARGLGRLDLLGLDLSSDPIKTWPSRNNLTTKWLAISQSKDARLNSSYGYLDLSGQLRSALDQFERVSLVSFTVVGAILILFLILVAADYFLMRHVLKRMELTWITLPIYCLVTCGAIFWLFGNSKSSEPLANQAEVIDIDATSGQVTTRLWTNIYSPTAQQLDLEIGNNRLNVPPQSSEIGWNGLAGTGMGGMMSTKLSIGSDRPYRIVATSEQPQHLRALDLPFDVASTRSLRGAWSGQWPGDSSTRITRRADRDRLQGIFTNSLPVELKDCFLVSGGWAYRFRGTLPPGTSVDIETQTDHISLNVWLTRRRTISENSSTNQAWNPVDDDLHRILELLMFYEIGGGQNYTQLLNQFEPALDFSELRLLDRAVFLGRSDESMSQVLLNGERLPAEQFDRMATAIRIVLPVESSNEN